MEELIDFDYIPDEGEDFRTAVPENPRSVEVETPIPAVVTSRIEVNEEWRVLRDYVVEQVMKYSGSFPRDGAKEKAIFRSFLARWGDKAMPIARVAFEVHQGVWHNAPIRIQRFCIGSDPYFASIIAKNLE